MANDTLKTLLQKILNDPDSFTRKQALMEVYLYEDARVSNLLRHVSEKDDDYGVRELAKSLYNKRQLIDVRPAASSVSVKEPMRQWSTTDTMFLFNKANADFVSGRTDRPKLGRGTMILFGVLFMSVFVIVGVATAFWAIYEYNIWQRLGNYGVTADGYFTGRRVSSSDDSDTHYVSYEFFYEGGVYTGEQQVDWEFYRQTEAGTPVKLLLLPDDPTISKMADRNEPPLFPFIFTFFWNFTTWTIVIIWIIVARSYGKLMREGRLVQGEVLQAKNHYDSDNDYILTVEYIFTAPDTREVITGRQSETDNRLKKVPMPHRGDPVAVMYRNKNHHRLL